MQGPWLAARIGLGGSLDRVAQTCRTLACLRSSRMLKNPSNLSFRGAAGDEESRKSFVSRARFLAWLGMTAITKVFQHPASDQRCRCFVISAIKRAVPALSKSGTSHRRHEIMRHACPSLVIFVGAGLLPAQPQVRTRGARTAAHSGRPVSAWRLGLRRR